MASSDPPHALALGPCTTAPAESTVHCIPANCTHVTLVDTPPPTAAPARLPQALARMKLDMGDIEDIIADADQDGDGCIDYYEFCELMRAL